MNDLSLQLLEQQNECTLCWITREMRPAATVVSFIYADNKIWMTATAGSARVKAIGRCPDVTVVISGKGSPLGHSRCVSLMGQCDILSDPAIRGFFFPAFAKAVLPGSDKGAQMMASTMNTPDNLVLVMTPTKTIPYDAQGMLDRANQM